MKSVDHSEYKQEYADDCFRCCAAFYLGMPLKKVPHFRKTKCFRRSVNRFFRYRGMSIVQTPYNKKLLSNKNKFYIVQGESHGKKSRQHAVIYKGANPYFDPHRTELFIKGELEYVWVIKKIKKPH